ncbi:hypothetical protein HYV86_06355 [Candidatus Woesearchaeota archaeon]|nr:hypothetical protein [Candidatus Woesearchaeota archaeon]
MATYNTNGLDMRETIQWYTSSNVGLPSLEGATLPYTNQSMDNIILSPQQLGALFSLFPSSVRDRSILRKVIGKPVTWFHRDSATGALSTTENIEEALSPTAIVPSYIDYTPWGELKRPTADIWIYALPDDIPIQTKRIITAQGFLHEVGHSIVQPALYVKDYDLEFPDGKVINGLEALLEFANLAEQHSPISVYASTYRGHENKFENTEPEYDPRTAISEEMCETIAAYVLDFAFSGDEKRNYDPFGDRPEIKDFVKNFLEARKI